MASTVSRTARSNRGSSIVITATPKKRVPVSLLGEDYMIKPPKMALLLAISSHADDKDQAPGAVNRDFQTILKLMFVPKDLVRVQERLNSADDDLDLDHIFEAVEAVAEVETGDPTS